ncbi:Protein NDX-6 [Aphelenchoides avenae]|nr:Protein NDX-6 [Aphelenchus avenae]
MAFDFSKFVHKRCRDITKAYLRSSVHRTQVPDDKVRWEVPWPDYKPPDYTAETLKGKPWADQEEDLSRYKWNALDEGINRQSHFTQYKTGEDGRPLNPIGRTGLRGRGILGRWGPNHAADPIVSRFHDGKLQFIGIERHDTGEWAIPGGMVDLGEEPLETLKREFTEEALDNVSHAALEELWNSPRKEIFKGYVDDPRNTDNAWMESYVVNWHDTADILDKVAFKAGDDARNVKWVTVEPGLKLYASHGLFITLLAKTYGVDVKLE